MAFVLPEDGNEHAAQALEPDTANKVNVAIGVASAQSAVLAKGIYRIQSDVDCFIEIGTNPTATTSSLPLAANAMEVWHIREGQKIAVIQKSGAGNLSIVPLI